MLLRTRANTSSKDLMWTIETYGNGWISAIDFDNDYIGLESVHFDTPNSVYVGITLETYPNGSNSIVLKRSFTATTYEEYTIGDWFCGSSSSCGAHVFYRCGHYSSLNGVAIIKYA